MLKHIKYWIGKVLENYEESTKDSHKKRMKRAYVDGGEWAFQHLKDNGFTPKAFDEVYDMCLDCEWDGEREKNFNKGGREMAEYYKKKLGVKNDA